MSPRYRGDGDDWLDEKTSRKAGPRPPQKKNQAEALESGEANATVAEVFPGQCRVRLDAGGELACKYRRAQVLGHARENADSKIRERSPVAVGDRVLAERVGGEASKEGIVAGVCKRRNRIVRPAPDRDESLRHVIAANLDTLVIVGSCVNPDFTPGLVDRFAVAALSQGIVPVLVITKMDLKPPGDGPSPWSLYADVGIAWHEVSVRTGQGLPELLKELKGKTVAFCGKSGVGKTSLLNALTGGTAGKEGHVSDATGKGRHTTSSALLLQGEAGTNWIDTPGVREFGLVDLMLADLQKYFPELSRPGCAQEGCMHRGEEGCGAAGLPRHASYLRILESLEAGEN